MLGRRGPRPRSRRHHLRRARPRPFGGACTLGDLERHDVAAAVVLGTSMRPIRAVVLVGASMGASSSLRYAAADHAVTGLVTLSCPARWRLPRSPRVLALLTCTPAGRALTARYLGVTVARQWTDPPPPLELAPRVSAPFAVLHGAADSFIPASDGRAHVGGACGNAATRRGVRPRPRLRSARDRPDRRRGGLGARARQRRARVRLNLDPPICCRDSVLVACCPDPQRRHLRAVEQQASDLSEGHDQIDGDAEVERDGDGGHRETDEDRDHVDD